MKYESDELDLPENVNATVRKLNVVILTKSKYISHRTWIEDDRLKFNIPGYDIRNIRKGQTLPGENPNLIENPC